MASGVRASSARRAKQKNLCSLESGMDRVFMRIIRPMKRLMPLAAVALLWTVQARAAFTDNNLSVTVTANLSSACPGGVVPVTVAMTAIKNFGSQSPTIYGEYMAGGNADLCTQFDQTTQPNASKGVPAWFVVEKNTLTTSPDPQTDMQNWSGSTWPNNGGYVAGVLSQGQSEMVTFQVEIPATMIPGRTYDLMIGVNLNYQNNSGASEGYDCIPFTVPATCPTTPAVSLSKSVDSELIAGQDSLYLINYSFTGTGAANFVQDVVPSCLAVVDESTNPANNTSAALAGNTVTWQVQNAAPGTTVSGVLYVEVQDGTCTNGSQVCNTAAYSTAGGGGPWTSTPMSETCTTAGGIDLSLSKTQENFGGDVLPNGAFEAAGATVTYVLSYTFVGTQLNCFDGFKGATVGSYQLPSSGTGNTAYPGTALSTDANWIAASAGTAYDATWNVVDDINAESGNYLYYPNAGYSNAGYNVLLDTCASIGVAPVDSSCPPPGGVSFCGGELISDVQLMQAGDGSEDVGIVLRTDDNPADEDFGDQYLVLLSVDSFSSAPDAGYAGNFPAGTCGGGTISAGNEGLGHLFIQKNINGAANAASFNAPANSAGSVAESVECSTVVLDTWYTVKVLEVPSANCGCSFGPCSDTIYAKYWPAGSLEPSAWMISFTDPDAFGCEGNWLPGVGGQNGQAAYDNYRVYGSSSLTGGSLWDTVPAGITYVSSNPAAQLVPGTMVAWNFTNNLNGAINGLVYPGAGSFTWTGTVACTGESTITNIASISMMAGVGLLQASNQTLLNVCNTPVDTSTSTVTPALTDTPTFTVRPTFTASPTATPVSGSATPTATPSPTWTLSASPTAIPPSLLLTPHYPNPNPAGGSGIWLPYTINTAAWVIVKIYDVSGELVRTWASDPEYKSAAGTYERFWDLRNTYGVKTASGIYMVQIDANSTASNRQEAWEKCAVVR